MESRNPSTPPGMYKTLLQKKKTTTDQGKKLGKLQYFGGRMWFALGSNSSTQ